MSSKPYPEGVQIVRQALARLHQNGARLSQITREMTTLTTEQAALRDECQKDRQILFEKMDAMDVKSSGNAGWHGRFEWFIIELYRQISAISDQ